MGLGLVCWSPGGNTAPVDTGATPVYLVTLVQLGQQRQMQALPDVFFLPVAQAAPAGHAATEAQFLRQILPWDAGGEDKLGAIEDGLVIQTRTPVLAGAR